MSVYRLLKQAISIFRSNMENVVLIDKEYFFSRIDKKYHCCYYDLIEYIVSTLNRYAEEGLTQSEFLCFLDAGRDFANNSKHFSVCYILSENIRERHSRAQLNEIPERCYCNSIAYLKIQMKYFIEDRAKVGVNTDKFLYETMKMCAFQANFYKF